MAASAVRSGFLPKGVNTEGAAIIALKSRELGLPLMVGFAHIYIVNGKPGMSAELIQAQARKNLPGLTLNILETTNDKCTVQGKRPERDSKPVTLSFSIEDARKANLLTKDVWKQYPAAMLRSRAITALLRVLCPDALMGVSYTPEEMGANVDEEGRVVIETTSRPVETETPKVSTQENPPEPPPHVADAEFELKIKSEYQRISLLKKELGIADEDLKQAVYREYGVDDATKLSLDQLKGVVTMLEKESEARKIKEAGTEEVAPWEQETPTGFIG
jgi:hypothetical protein